MYQDAATLCTVNMNDFKACLIKSDVFHSKEYYIPVFCNVTLYNFVDTYQALEEPIYPTTWHHISED
jgi:hypothetical protein